MSVVVLDYENLPNKDGYRISGWRVQIDGPDELRTNVTQKVNGSNVPVWPMLVNGVWTPDCVVVS